MPRGKSNRGDNRGGELRNNRGGRQNASSQRSSSMDEDNQRSTLRKGTRGSQLQTGSGGRISSEESNRSE
jgi:hypothetical protein